MCPHFIYKLRLGSSGKYLGRLRHAGMPAGGQAGIETGLRWQARQVGVGNGLRYGHHTDDDSSGKIAAEI